MSYFNEDLPVTLTKKETLWAYLNDQDNAIDIECEVCECGFYTHIDRLNLKGHTVKDFSDLKQDILDALKFIGYNLRRLDIEWPKGL